MRISTQLIQQWNQLNPSVPFPGAFTAEGFLQEGVTFVRTPQEQLEAENCNNDPLYFAKLLGITLTDAQKFIISSLKEEKTISVSAPRQSGTTYAMLIWSLHRLLFGSGNYVIFEVKQSSHKSDTLRSLFSQVPLFLCSHIKSWNNDCIASSESKLFIKSVRSEFRDREYQEALYDQDSFMDRKSLAKHRLELFPRILDLGGRIMLVSTGNTSTVTDDHFKKLFIL